MTTPTRTGQTLAELALQRPSAARVLARLGLDYCCGGARSLEEACRDKGLDAKTVAAFLDAENEPVSVESTDWTTAPLATLCEHIVEAHHARLRWDLPRLAELAERAERAHAAQLPALKDLRAELAELRSELEHHIEDEERTLFPLIARGAQLEGHSLDELLHDHSQTGERLARLRELGGGYNSETALCNVHRTLLLGLHALELDLHQHVHEENNVLFPRALAELS